jgi:hypothetical protein
MTDSIEQAYLAAATEGRLAADRLQRAFDERVRDALERYYHDAEYHARVYQVARVIDNDPDFTGLHFVNDLGPQWELALGLALKATVAIDEMQPGGILAVTP